MSCCTVNWILTFEHNLTSVGGWSLPKSEGWCPLTDYVASVFILFYILSKGDAGLGTHSLLLSFPIL